MGVQTGVPGNYGNRRAALSEFCKWTGSVSCRCGPETLRNICGVSVACTLPATSHGLFDVARRSQSRDIVTRLRLLAAEGAGSSEVPAGELAWNDRNHRPRHLRPIGAGYDLNWLPQPHRFSYALR
jgi:hypothetical protein